MSHRVSIVDSGEVFACAPGESVLHGMARLGRRGIPVGCRGGGCGVCRIEVLEGRYEKRVMSRAHISAADEAAGRALACRIFPLEDLRLRVIGPLHKAVTRPMAAG